jgi:hypothetical protein
MVPIGLLCDQIASSRDRHLGDFLLRMACPVPPRQCLSEVESLRSVVGCARVENERGDIGSKSDEFEQFLVDSRQGQLLRPYEHHFFASSGESVGELVLG